MGWLLLIFSQIYLTLVITFQPKVFDGCHDLMQNTICFNGFPVVSVKTNNFGIRYGYVSQDEAINIMKNCCLIKKVGPLDIKKL